ncbi:MAG: SCO family protein [Rhodobacteraceae bacterium]|nr:SCO family protein [Paracoccaceae bacterium]
MIRVSALAALAWAAIGPAQAGPLPFDVGGPYELIDQRGEPRSQVDPDGHAQLLFFGYANCPGICSAAMPMMAEVTDILAENDLKISPVMITIDPEHDVVGSLGAPMADLHADFIALTGTKAALEQAYKAYSVEKELIFVDPEHGAIYSHGSFIYLLDAQGEVLTLMPPVLDADRAASIILGYLRPND